MTCRSTAVPAPPAIPAQAVVPGSTSPVAPLQKAGMDLVRREGCCERTQGRASRDVHRDYVKQLGRRVGGQSGGKCSAVWLPPPPLRYNRPGPVLACSIQGTHDASRRLRNGCPRFRATPAGAFRFASWCSSPGPCGHSIAHRQSTSPCPIGKYQCSCRTYQPAYNLPRVVRSRSSPYPARPPSPAGDVVKGRGRPPGSP